MQTKKVQTDEYECALELSRIVEQSRLSPIMTMVIYEFLCLYASGENRVDPSIYEKIQQMFTGKFQMMVIGNSSDVDNLARSKAYLILMLEILCHADLVKGLSIPLEHFTVDKAANFSIRLDADNFEVTKRGRKFIENVERLKENQIVGNNLLDSLKECTLNELDYILRRYRRADGVLDDDVIVIKNIQA
ncbi:MAG: hypothetical protein ACI4M9_09410 [Succinivibrio sp.]